MQLRLSVFGLVIRTPRLVLRLPRESDLPALAQAAREIAGPGEPRLQMPWMYEQSPAMEHHLVQRHWRSLAHWKPESWHLALAIYMDDEPVGVQDIWANDFVRARSVGTGSWITRSRQGKGFGAESRSAVLEFAFSCLSADEARTEYYHDNITSERVSRKLGYMNNGERLTYREGSGQITEYHLRLTRERWQQARNGQRAVIAGFSRCASMLLAAYLSAHRTMINGSAPCAARLSRSVLARLALLAAEARRLGVSTTWPNHSWLISADQPVRCAVAAASAQSCIPVEMHDRVRGGPAGAPSRAMVHLGWPRKRW